MGGPEKLTLGPAHAVANDGAAVLTVSASRLPMQATYRYGGEYATPPKAASEKAPGQACALKGALLTPPMLGVG